MTEYTFDIADDLDTADTKSKTDGHIRTGTVESTISESKIARFEEKCKACRGSGKFTSYTGRIVGPCFKCNGEGVRRFKTSPEARGKAQAVRERNRSRLVTEKADAAVAWSAAPENRARRDWLLANQSWDFARSLSDSLIKYGRLTDNQIAAIDRSIAKQAVKEAAHKVQDEKGLDISGIRSGRYLAGDAEIKVDNISKEGRWNGWIFVKHADGEGRIGSQKPGGTYRGKLEKELAEIAKDPLAAAIAYGRETGTCCICGRELTNPDSIAAGIGPICATKF